MMDEALEFISLQDFQNPFLKPGLRPGLKVQGLVMNQIDKSGLVWNLVHNNIRITS